MGIVGWLCKCKVNFKRRWKTSQFRKYACFGENTKFDATSVCENNTGDKTRIVLGNNGFFRGHAKVVGNGKIEIGDRVYVGGGTIIGSCESISIGHDVIIAGDCRIYDNNNHPTAPIDRLEMSRSGDFFGITWQWNEKVQSKPIIIEDNVWIGERCTVLKGVKIGTGAIIGCNTVVTHNVPAYCIVAGNPARVVKELPKPEGEG